MMFKRGDKLLVEVTALHRDWGDEYPLIFVNLDMQQSNIPNSFYIHRNQIKGVNENVH